ncbi:MAG: hypothetical protein IJ769_03140 [Clostridia bacterium]|nr:hypothetical protein [Clostridia bacterium]
MKHVSINEFATFRVHDCAVEALTIENDRVVCVLDSIDVTTDNTLNDQPTDMQAEPARATFEGFAVEQIHCCGRACYNEDGELIECVPSQTLAPEAYGECLEGLREDIELHNLYLFAGEALESSEGRRRARVDFGGVEVTFSYTRLTVAWGAFTKRAWYMDFNK